MKDSELVSALRSLKASVKPMVCIDCTEDNDCIIHGCNLIGIAADRIDKVDSALRSIKTLYDGSHGTMHSTLRDVLRLFGSACDPSPEAAHGVYDFQFCRDVGDLRQIVGYINANGLDLISVTQDASGKYTVFFRRPLRE